MSKWFFKADLTALPEQGSVVVVELKERDVPPDMVPEDQPCNMVSSSSGQVVRLVRGLGGMDIRYRCSRDTYGKDAFIALMGPGMNLLSCGVGAFLANRLPWEGIYLFCGCSALLGCFNLLPALPLDGGVFLRAMLLRRGELEWSDRVLTASSLAVGVLLLCAGAVLFVSSGGNCTLLVCAGAVLGRLVRNYFTPGRKSFIV